MTKAGVSFDWTQLIYARIFLHSGCIPADEMKFVLSQVCSVEAGNYESDIPLRALLHQEAEEMLEVVDRNGDGVISYSEFRCMMGAHPLLF